MQLKDVAVLITGGGSGLGAATARAMAAKGAKIGVIDQNKENAEKVAAEVKGVALHADVTDEEAIKAAIAKAEDAPQQPFWTWWLVLPALATALFFAGLWPRPAASSVADGGAPSPSGSDLGWLRAFALRFTVCYWLL